MAEIKKIMLSYQKKINFNSDRGLKTLTVVYFGGHGMMKDNLSQIVMPDGQTATPLFNLENKLRAFGMLDNSFVIGIFDCCREPFKQDIFKPKEMRSGLGTEEKKAVVKEGRNVFLIFGCPP